jgi:ubiquinone/menaquinone biosynthesis C-methylase UbiE
MEVIIWQLQGSQSNHTMPTRALGLFATGLRAQCRRLVALRRYQCVEFCDQPWLRGWLRDGFLDCLSFAHRTYQPYHWLQKPFEAWAADAGAHAVLDLASGSAEHIAMLLQANASETGAEFQSPRFIVSDLHPDIRAWQRLQKEFGPQKVEYIEAPLDALNIPEGLPRHWSIFTAFHHFSPAAARKFLEAFCDKADGLCIIEFTQRGWRHLAIIVLAIPINLIVPFFAKEFMWSKFLFTTVIPIIPLMVTFDGLVSVMRTYSKDEIIRLLPPDRRSRVVIDYHEARWRFGPMRVTMLSLRQS